MLNRLALSNLATISDTVLEPGPGLNVLTGETGAGKSILIDGLLLAMGARADKTLVRPGARLASVEAVFGDERGELCIRREVFAEGRSRVFIDDALSTLEEVIESLDGRMGLHTQRSTPALLRKPMQVAMLDGFAGCVPLARRYAVLFNRYRTLLSRSTELSGIIAGFASRREIVLHELSLFKKLSPTREDYESLREERSRLEKAQELALLYGGLSEALEGDDGFIGRLAGFCRNINASDPGQSELVELLGQAGICASEAARLGRGLLGEFEDAPERLGEMDERLDAYARLISRTGGSLEKMLGACERLGAELAGMEALEEELSALTEGRPALEDELSRCAEDLELARTEASVKLADHCNSELRLLRMPSSAFSVGFTPASRGIELSGRSLGPVGLSEPEFLFTANTGMPPGPLAAIASGGELSRVALALELALAGASGVSTLVFDEIDSGTGGETAHSLGESLARAGAARQVIVITHLAQVAGRADRNIVVEKRVVNGMPESGTRVLMGDDERVLELARLLGGGEAAVQHARSMLLNVNGQGRSG
jgi:DNA repair protein RecN (Recombination protein N)